MSVEPYPSESEPNTPTPVGNRHGWIGLPDIPAPTTPLFGRDTSIRAVVSLVRDPDARLITLTGPGGIGKTRLAIAVAQALGGDVGFVPLASVAQAELVATAIAQHLDIELTSAEPAALVLRRALRTRQMMLVLDNVEHLLAATPLITDLLQACPHLTILATSRVRLSLSGEHVHVVEPLSLPSDANEIAHSSAVQLFVDRARAAHPSFQLTTRNASAVATICERLDGLPLAIELAAARSNLLSPEALAARLEHRLELLTGGPRDAPARLQTMRAAISWSIDLLDETERAIWERLGVFVGGFTAEAAEAVARDDSIEQRNVLDLLESLIGQGLLRATANAEGEPRFAMLETAREFALEQLAGSGREASTRSAHAAWFVEFAKRAEPGLMSADPDMWFHRVEADIPNLRAAMTWLQDRGEIQPALELAGALAWFWTAPNHVAEGRSWYATLLQDVGADVDHAVLAKALMSAGDLADWHSDTDLARELNEQALVHWRAAGDRRGITASLRSLGSIAIDRFAFDDAESLLTEAHTLAQETGDLWNAAAAANLLAVALTELGRFDDAVRWHEVALRRWQQQGDRSHFPPALNGLAWAYMYGGHLQRAWDALDAALNVSSPTELDTDTTWTLVGFAKLATLLDHPRQGSRLIAAATSQRRQLGLPFRPPFQRRIERLIDTLRSMVGNVSFTQAWTEGESLTVAAAVEETRSITMPSAHGGDTLSRREREVLELLIEGASDNEIADTLFITRRTASKHVAAILEKLGAANRTAAVTIAHRRGLV